MFFPQTSRNSEHIRLGKGPKKKCKSVVFDQTGGGSPKTKLLLQKLFFFLKLTTCPQTYPIQKEIVVSAILVVNSLCSDHFLIA